MLPDDELDFEDFGDLGDVDGPELTNEELEALEQELRDENASSLNQVDQGEQNKKAAQETATAAAKAPLKTSASTTATSVALEKKEENTVNNNLEEGETLNDARPVPNKPGFTQQQQQQLPKFSKYNNNYKYNAYNRNGFYNQRPIPMNNMFPQYPPFSNRIYVNPKFNKGTVGASQHMQLQQQQQQQQFMEMEAQRMLLMQRQMQLLQQEQKRLAELDQKRREATEIMRQKQLQKNAESGEKRPRPVDSNYDRAAKRQERFAPSPAGGITIKGVAAARNNSLPPENISYQPPNERRVSSPYERKSTASFDRKPYEKPSITSRLGNTANSAVSKASIAPNKNSSALITATPVLPIVTNGKSNILIIKGLGKDTKEQDIRSMTNEINGGVHEIKLDSNTNSATVSFSSVESAVTFRRKYNRFQMGESHINISFQK